MGKKRPEKKADPLERFNAPFASLAGKLGPLPIGGPAPGLAAPAPPEGPPRAVIRYERKGRGGKEVTLVEQLGLRPAELERWLKDARSALGCGGTLEGTSLVLQGDQRDRLQRWLTGRGVRRISVDLPDRR